MQVAKTGLYYFKQKVCWLTCLRNLRVVQARLEPGPSECCQEPAPPSSLSSAFLRVDFILLPPQQLQLAILPTSLQWKENAFSSEVPASVSRPTPQVTCPSVEQSLWPWGEMCHLGSPDRVPTPGAQGGTAPASLQTSWSEGEVCFPKDKSNSPMPEIGNACPAGGNSRWKS